MMFDLAQRNGVSLASAPSKQDVQFIQHLTQHRSRRSTCEDRPPGPPVQALDLIRKDHARYAPCGRERHFKRVAFYSGRNRTDERQASLAVVGARAEDKRGTPPSLLVSRLRAESQPYDIPAIGNVAILYHTSSPTAGPVSTSECRVSGVIRATISLRS